MTLASRKALIRLMPNSAENDHTAEKLSKNSSGSSIDTALAPRTVGRFTVNFCRNPLCASFSLPPILHNASRTLARGIIKGAGENRAYNCNGCGQSSRLISNVALVEEYSRLRYLNRGTKREYCPNSGCSSHRVPLTLMPSAYRVHGKTPKGDDLPRDFSSTVDESPTQPEDGQ